jgi:tetratricopeptide (TPR) repeat protein
VAGLDPGHLLQKKFARLPILRKKDGCQESAMHGRVKLSKREIKEDKFTSFILTAKDQFMESWQYAVIAVVVVALIVAGIVFWVNSRRGAQSEAGTKLAGAMADYQRNNIQVALLSLGQIVDGYSGDAAEQAAFLLGKLNVESKNYAEATKRFEHYLATFPGNKLLRAASIAGIASCMEGEGKSAEAAARYTDAAREYPGGPQEEDFQIAALRNYLDANDLVAAKNRLDELKKTFGGSGKVYRAEIMFSEKNPVR